MKVAKKILSSEIGPIIIILAILFLASDWISNRPQPKTTRQVGLSSDHVRTLWVKKMYLWDHVTDWSSNTIYVTDPTSFNEKLLAIDSSTGSNIWEASLMGSNRPGELNQWGVGYLLTVDQTVFSVTSAGVNAYRASTGEWLWSTKLGDGHVAIRAQDESSLIRVYYGDKIFEISQASGEILAILPKDDIVWIQNNVEVHCPLSQPQDKGADPNCWIGLTGIDRVTGKTLWKNNKAHFSKYYQEQAINNVVLVGFSEDGICALYPDTGGYSWCLQGGKISNIAVNEDQKIGYFLRNDFSLVKINLLTGDILAETEFLPKILPTEMQQNSYGYIVAVTQDAVIVSFGDSDQTFGLKINP